MYKKFGSTMLHILIPANHANVRDATTDGYENDGTIKNIGTRPKIV